VSVLIEERVCGSHDLEPVLGVGPSLVASQQTQGREMRQPAADRLEFLLFEQVS